MKYLVLITLLSGEFAWPQVSAGTVIIISFSPKELTIAADSRRNSPETGEHADTECKISAFGPNFVFAMAGAVGSRDKWNAHSIARGVWETESKSESNATKLVPLVTEEWIKQMVKLYEQPGVISRVRKTITDEPVLANAIFSGTDTSGNLVVKLAKINFDMPLFDSTGAVRILHDSEDARPGALVFMGHSEIADEFWLQTSPRAKVYMRQLYTQISPLDRSQQHVAIASKFVELSILLHPKKNELGFPIDVVQLRKTTGVHWAQIKSGCPQN